MVGLLITGHGNFATSLLSSVNLIAGKQDNVLGVDFLESFAEGELSSKLKSAMEQLGSDILVLADLAGGSPFNKSVILKEELKEKSIEVIAGVNVPMILSIIFDRDGVSTEDIAQSAINAGKDGITMYKTKKVVQCSCDDGI